MPAAAGCALLVTSRSRHTTVDSDLDVEVPALSPADARSLLFRHAGRVSNSRAVDRVAELCEFLPLALRVAAARLADRTGSGSPSSPPAGRPAAAPRRAGRAGPCRPIQHRREL
jgi:hypothetical protein